MSWRKSSNLAWLRDLPGVREGEPLATRTSFGIGGPAEFFIEAANPQSIERALEGCRLRGIPYLLLGAGTNLLVADAGLEGLVVRVVNRDYEVDGTRIRAGAGLKMMRLARIAADANLRGFEFAIGVPGTVGGAVYQNAGCWGKELREVLVEARGFQPGADRRTWSPQDLAFGYRTSALRDGPLRGSLVIDATIKLERGDGEEAKRLMTKLKVYKGPSHPHESQKPQPLDVDGDIPVVVERVPAYTPKPRAPKSKPKAKAKAKPAARKPATRKAKPAARKTPKPAEKES